MIDLEKIYCEVDDFCKTFIPSWENHLLESGLKHRHKPSRLSDSEVMTILILFHQFQHRNFKTFYIHYVSKHLKKEFPYLVSYSQMIKRLQRVLTPLTAFMTQRYGKPTGIAFVDATKIAVCHNIRIPRNKVFDGYAERGKGSMGWFYGFKLHLIVNDCGEILSISITKGNVDDRKPLPDMIKNLSGTLYADKGYISQSLTEQLAEKDIKFVTGIRKNMKAKTITLWDKLMLRKRFIIETIFDQLKNISQIEHSRHRSPISCMVHLIAGMIAYTFQPKKPAIKMSRNKNMLIRI